MADDMARVIDVVESEPAVVLWACTPCNCVERQDEDARMPAWLNTRLR